MAVNMALAAIMVACFALAIGLVRVLGWMIDRDPVEGPDEISPVRDRTVG